MKFYFPFENNVLSLFRYVLVKRHFPLISPFTDNTQIISLDFPRFHLHHSLREKKDVISAKSLKLVKLDE